MFQVDDEWRGMSALREFLETGKANASSPFEFSKELIAVALIHKSYAFDMKIMFSSTKVAFQLMIV